MRKIIILIILCPILLLILNQKKFTLNIDQYFEKKIVEITIHNLKHLKQDFILQKIRYKVGQSFWNFKSKKLISDLNQIKEVKNFSFKMEKNGILNIHIYEVTPFMVWKFSNKINFINSNGEILKLEIKNYKQFITIEGNLNPKELDKFSIALYKNNDFKLLINKIIYEENIGWKVFLKDNTCVYLPKEKIDRVINVYKKIKKLSIDNNYKFYDMRVLERVYLNTKNKCLIS